MSTPAASESPAPAPSAEAAAPVEAAQTPPASNPRAYSVIEKLRKPVSRLAAVGVVAAALFLTPHKGGPVQEILCEAVGFTLIMLAALGRIWCSIYISGRKNHVLCTEGPYSLSRNPLYFFSFLGVIGFFLAMQHFIALGGAAALFLVYYHFVIRTEEKRLAQLFGDDYARYTRETPRFFPAWRPIRQVEAYTINPKVIERSLREVLCFLLAIVFVEVADAVSWPLF